MMTMNAFALAVSLSQTPDPPAQARDPCTLLTPAEVQTLAPGKKAPAGVAQVVSGPAGVTACRYDLGSGSNASAGTYTLTVTLSDAARAYPGAKPGEIKQALAKPLNAGDPPAIMISKVGDGAYYKSTGGTRADGLALVKGQVLQVTLEGAGAESRRRQVIALLRSAAGRL